MGLVNSALSSQSILPMGPKPKVIESAPIETLQTPEKPIQSKESFDAARLTQVGKGEQVVNASQTSQQIKQGIDQADSGHLLEQSQTLLQSSVVSEEFGLTIPKAPPLPPPPKPSPFKPSSGSSAITADMLVAARQKLKTVSQHQVLNLGDLSTGSTAKESTVSRKLGSEVGGVPLDRDTLPSADGTIDIVGHSSDGGMTIEGRNPQQLAQLLKDQYGLQQIQTIHLVSCKSEAFKAEFKQALADLGVTVGNVEAAKGNVAVDRATGKTLDDAVVGDLGQIEGHDGELGKYTVQGLLDTGLIGQPEKIGTVLIVPFKNQSTRQIAEIGDKQRLVARAVNQAFGEFSRGEIYANFLADGDTLTSAHIPYPSGNFERVITRADEIPRSLVSAAIGYLIEERVTQLLLLNAPSDFDSRNFQQAMYSSRPDIVIARGSLVDITAVDSVGHILDKDPNVWMADGTKSFEVIYPSPGYSKEDFIGSIRGSVRFAPEELAQLREKQEQEKREFIDNLQQGLVGEFDNVFRALVSERFPDTPVGDLNKTQVSDLRVDALKEMARQIGGDVDHNDVRHALMWAGKSFKIKGNLPPMLDSEKVLTCIMGYGTSRGIPDFDKKAMVYIYSSDQDMHQRVQGRSSAASMVDDDG